MEDANLPVLQSLRERLGAPRHDEAAYRAGILSTVGDSMGWIVGTLGLPGDAGRELRPGAIWSARSHAQPRGTVMIVPPPRHFAPPARVAGSDFSLRCWLEGDAPLLRKALQSSDAHLRAFTPWVVDGREPGLSLESRLRRHGEAFKRGDEWVYGIFDRDATEVLGGCGLYPRVGPGAIEIGYWLSAAQTGRGIATQCTRLLMLLAFAAPSLGRVEIHCDPRNERSALVPRRLGFRRVGLASEAGGEARHPIDVWAITRDEFAGQDRDGR